MGRSTYGALQDLELIMDHNVQRALGSAPALASSPPAVLEEPAVKSTVEDVCEGNEVDGGQYLPAQPFPAAASISLALGSVLSSSLVLTKPGLVPQAPSRNVRSAMKLASPAAPSQKKSHSPIPVMASSKVQVALDIPASTPVSTSKKVTNYVSAFPDYDRLRGPEFKEPGNPAGLRRASIVWFRNDLRVHDNEALVTASRDSLSILPVYCFDPRDYGKSSSGFDKTGPYRAKFLLECVANLRENLRHRGSDLIIRIGKPEEVIVKLAQSVGADALYAHQEVTFEELQAEGKVSAALKDQGVEAKYFWGSTLFHIDDLPFKLDEMPSNYGGFREKVKNVCVRDTVDAPQHLKGLPVRGGVKPGDIPSLQELGLSPPATMRQDSHAAGGALLVGGEDEAMKRLQRFALEAPGQAPGKTKVTSSLKPEGAGDSLYGANFSCKISPWLAMGCLSPRHMFEDLKKNGSRGGVSANAGGKSTDDSGLNWLVYELLWRDFFRFITKKYGSGKKSQDSSPATACTESLIAA